MVRVYGAFKCLRAVETPQWLLVGGGWQERKVWANHAERPRSAKTSGPTGCSWSLFVVVVVVIYKIRVKYRCLACRDSQSWLQKGKKKMWPQTHTATVRHFLLG